MTEGKRVLWGRRQYTTAAVLAFLITAHLARLSSYKRKEPRFFFENATPEIVAAGQPREKQLRAGLTNLKRIFITDYMKWHAATVSAIKQGKKPKGTVRTVIYSGSGGLGDRFRGLLYAFFRCVYSGRLLLIQSDKPYPLSRAFVDQLGFNSTYDPIYFSPQVLSNGSYDELYVGRYNHSDVHYFSAAGTIWMTAAPSVSLRDVFLLSKRFPGLSTSDKLLQILPLKKKPKGAEFFPLLFRALFRPTQDLRNMMSESMNPKNVFSLPLLNRENNHFTRIEEGHEAYLSVHARLGYGVREINERFDLEKKGHTLESVAKCMAIKALEIGEDMNVSPPRFYLATDTVEFRDMFEKAILEQDREAKVMYGMWDVKHVSALRTQNSEDLMQYLHTFMDLYMLSKGKGMLQTKSGFSDLAVWMGGIQRVTKFHVNDCVA